MMSTFTSSLPDNLLRLLDEKAKELSLPKNKLIERALSLYLDHLNRAAYVKSYKQMAADVDLLAIVEEGMTDYFGQIEAIEDASK
jgi:predicted transcriptional regulator